MNSIHGGVRRHYLEFGVAGLFLALFAAVWLWQNPGVIRGRLRADEIAHFMDALDKLPLAAEERPDITAHVRAWMEADDGRPVYMLNLMRFYPELHQFAGAPSYGGTPRESNAKYEAAVMPMLLRLGGYPIFAGRPQGKNLMDIKEGQNDWSRVLVVRYPSRRSFIQLLASPEFQSVAPYKLMALQVMLTPMAPEIVIPELPLLAAGVLLPLYCAIFWWRAARRRHDGRLRA